MNRLQRLAISIAALCLGLACLSGCASNAPRWVPFREEPDRVAGVAAPKEKLQTLRKLAKDAGARNAEEKQQVVDDLAKALSQEDDPMIRAEIITTLSHYPGTPSDKVLRAAVRDPDPDVRIAACKAWAKRGGRESTQMLGGVLGSDLDVDVRIAAVKGLGQTRDPNAVSILGNVLEDSEPALKHEAVVALRDVSGKDYGEDINQWRQFAKGVEPKPAQPVSVAERLRHAF